jgi:hypothetical protein
MSALTPLLIPLADLAWVLMWLFLAGLFIWIILEATVRLFVWWIRRNSRLMHERLERVRRGEEDQWGNKLTPPDWTRDALEDS